MVLIIRSLRCQVDKQEPTDIFGVSCAWFGTTIDSPLLLARLGTTLSSLQGSASRITKTYLRWVPTDLPLDCGSSFSERSNNPFPSTSASEISGDSFLLLLEGHESVGELSFHTTEHSR